MKLSLAAALAATVVCHSAALAQTASHRLYISVVDSAARPIGGLTSADVAAVEGGVPRQITRIAPGNDPLRLLLLVDTSAAMCPSLGGVRKAVPR